MKTFEHVNATSVAAAVNLLSPDGQSRPIAGGTDLLTQMKLRIVEPNRLVNLKTIPRLNSITSGESGLKIGALVTLDTIGSNKVVRDKYPALVQAIEVAASPQLRNSGTIGGNLAQGSRCWYYRGQLHCWLKGGKVCYAKEGENSHHAIFGGGPCYTVHPSDPALALVALGAEASIIGPKGERIIPLEDLFQMPQQGSRQLTTLEPQEIITGILVPTPAPGSKGIYLKAMERKVWAFALVSVAVQLVMDGDTVRYARVVLGGVAPKPWRLPQIEKALHNQHKSPAVISEAAKLAATGAQPIGYNRYKIALVKAMVTEALSSI
jgi:xanthine dehydrogenase YagS FAD-binding subunit